MIVWVASAGRSGNTFFRIIMHHLYGIHTYAAFNASEVLIAAGAEKLVGADELPPPLKKAMATADREKIRLALEELDRSKELYVFKTHAEAHELFGTEFRAILIVRDGRDALASYAHYLVDLRFDTKAFKHRLRRMVRSRSELLKAEGWAHLGKIILISSMKRFGLRKRLISWRIDQLLDQNHRLHYHWSTMNRSWLERKRKPVLVYFDALIRDPIATVTEAVNEFELSLIPDRNVAIPSFVELQKQYSSFFRKGVSGDWQNHFSVAQNELFKIEHEPMMKRLNFAI